MPSKAKRTTDETIPAFLKIPQAQRNATWERNPPKALPSTFVERIQTEATSLSEGDKTYREEAAERKKLKTEKRIANLKFRQEWKSIPEEFRRWDPRRGKFVDQRDDDERRLKLAAEKLGITLENDEMEKLTIVPYVEGQDLPVTRAKTTIKVDGPEWELHAKIRQAGIRAGKKLQRVEVVAPNGEISATWTLDETKSLLKNEHVPFTIPMTETEQEKTVATKAKKKVTSTKTKKATNGSGSKPEKGPGVIASIIETIKRDKGATADEILGVLVKRFPDRKKESMLSTIKIQANKNAKKKDKDEKRGLIYFG